jgi:hypothetical protein
MAAFLNPKKDEKGNITVIPVIPGRPPAGFNLLKDGTKPIGPDFAGAAEFPKYKPEAMEKVKELDKSQVLNDPVLTCMNPGLPRIGHPHMIMQTPGRIAFLYADLNGSFWRLIPTDGRPHSETADASLMGDSVGRWEGDTLVIETVNFSDVSWLIDNGAFHTSDMKVVERLTASPQGLLYEVTVHDPEVLAEPWTRKPRLLLPQAADPAHQPPCVEQSIQHMTTTDQYHANPR